MRLLSTLSCIPNTEPYTQHHLEDTPGDRRYTHLPKSNYENSLPSYLQAQRCACGMVRVKAVHDGAVTEVSSWVWRVRETDEYGNMETRIVRP